MIYQYQILSATYFRNRSSVGYAKLEACKFPCSLLVDYDSFRTQIAMDHFHTIVKKSQSLRDLNQVKQIH